MAGPQTERYRPLILALLGVPLLGVGMACMGAASLLAMLHLPKRSGIDADAARLVSLTSGDHLALKAAWTVPDGWTGRCVLFLHGVGSSRSAVQRYADPLIERGYAALAPDSRAHGQSEGDLITFGVLERLDTVGWVHWMREQGCQHIYGHGESMGASVLLIANATGPQPLFRAIVADCPYADLLDAAEYRARKMFPVPGMLAQALARVAVTSGGVYARWRYGLNFRQGSPEQSIAKVNTPVLLIHGVQDDRTPPEHSQRLAAANPKSTELWLVAGARHTGAFGAAGDEYGRRMTAWFAGH